MISLVRICVVFSLVIFLLHRKVGLGYTLLLASAVLGVLFAFSGSVFLGLVVGAFGDYRNMTLLINVISVTVFARFLVGNERSGELALTGNRILRDPRVVNLSLPLLIGLLPMPGGALFSAPLVKASRPSSETLPVTLTFTNYWFRHIWEYFLPLYPAIILVSSLSGLPLSWIILHHLPFGLVAAGAGWLVVRRELVDRRQNTSPAVKSRPLLTGFLLPIAIPVAVILAGGPLWLGVAGGITFSAVREKITLPVLLSSLWGKHSWPMLIDVAGILVFQAVLLGSGGIDQVMTFLISRNLPVLLPAVLLPFLVALLSGFTAASVGITFPVVLPLLAVYPTEAIVPLLFVSGYTGITFSPAHLCLVVSCRYFKTDLAQLYRKMLFPAGCVVALAWVRFLLLR